jgi:hypothetical protein
VSRYVGACDILFRLTGEGCCPSCAGEAQAGYPISEIHSPSRHGRLDGAHWSSVCCDHARMEPEDDGACRTWWAILLREHRKESRA